MSANTAPDDHEAVVYRHVLEHGPATAAALAAALGQEAARIGAILARLLDARRFVVASVNPEGEPVYAVAPAQSPD